MFSVLVLDKLQHLPHSGAGSHDFSRIALANDTQCPCSTSGGSSSPVPRSSPISQFLPFPVLLRLMRRYGVDPRYRARARAQLIFSAAVEPFRWWEKLRYGGQLRRTEVHPSPIFLLGYGRSGTTHLHNLLWQDPRLGVLSNYQASFQPIALTGRGRLERRMSGLLPSKRPMDNVAITLDGPQEEEIALVNSSEHAPLHFMAFPRALPGIYDRYVCELGADRATLEDWKRAYLAVLRKTTLFADGRPLVLKTPTNTARIPILLEMFPQAKFVHIVRNPYRVYQSMRNMYRKILPGQALQELDWEAIDEWTLGAYRSVMAKYLSDRKLLPRGQLFELQYEELDAQPMTVLEALYADLGIGDFASVRQRMSDYLESLGHFEKNQFDFPADVVDAVNQHWDFAFEAFGYERGEV